MQVCEHDLCSTYCGKTGCVLKKNIYLYSKKDLGPNPPLQIYQAKSIIIKILSNILHHKDLGPNFHEKYWAIFSIKKILDHIPYPPSQRYWAISSITKILGYILDHKDIEPNHPSQRFWPKSYITTILGHN